MEELTLEVIEGPDTGRRVALPAGASIEIGRSLADARAGLELRDEQVSRQHARVSAKERELALVEDLGSRNGTLVNGREAHGATILHPGDTIAIGVSVLELRSPGSPVGQPSMVRPVPVALRVPESTPDYIGDELLLPSRATPSLDALLDARVKQQARTAPLALIVLVALVVVIYLATR